MQKWMKGGVYLAILAAGIIIGNMSVAFGYSVLPKDQPKPEDPVPLKQWNENLAGLAAHDGNLVAADGSFIASYGVIATFLQGELAKAKEEAKAKDPCLVLIPAVADPAIQSVSAAKISQIDGDPKSAVNFGHFVVLNDSENAHSANQSIVMGNEKARADYLVAIVNQINQYRAVTGNSCATTESQGSGGGGYSLPVGERGGLVQQVLHPIVDQSGFSSTEALNNTDNAGSAGPVPTTPPDNSGGETTTTPPAHGPPSR